MLPLLGLALVPLLAPSLQDVAAPAAYVTQRTELRPDLSARSIAREALEASERVDVDPMILMVGGKHFDPGATALGAVANALAHVGLVEDARKVLDRAVKLADPAGPALPNLASAWSRVHTPEEARAWLETIADRERRVLGGYRLVQACLERDDAAATRHALQTLTGMHRHGWSPQADAWLTVGWRRLGDDKLARGWTVRVLAGPEDGESEVDFWIALGILVQDDLDRDAPDAAARSIAAYAGGNADAYRLSTVRKYVELGRLEPAAALAEAIEQPNRRAVALAEVGAGLLAAKAFEESKPYLTRAGELARDEGVLAVSWVLPVYARAGIDDAVDALIGHALDSIRRRPEGRRALDASFLAGAVVEAERGLVLFALEPWLDEKGRAEMVADVSTYHARNENLAGLASVFDPLTDADLRYKVLAAVVDGVEVEEHDDRYLAELARAVVARARALPHAEHRAYVLGRVVASGWVTPREPSSLHPWSLPPTLAGGWTTPGDADAYAALLFDALGERPRPEVRGIRRRALVCLEGGELVELDGIRGGLPYHYVLVRVGDRTTLLTGERAARDAALRGSKWRDGEAALLEHVHLAIAGFANEQRYRVAEDGEVLEALCKSSEELPELPELATKILERTETGARLEVAVFAGRRLEIVEATVAADGAVSIAPVRLISEELPLDREIPLDGGFWRIRTPLNDALALRREDDLAGTYAAALAFATGFGEGGWRKDPNLALSWMRHAEALGHPGPLRAVGHAWRDGEGVAADPNEAIEWLVAAASEGDLDAGRDAADLLLRSPSPERRARARALLQRGVDAGHAPSAKLLDDSGVPRGGRVSPSHPVANDR